MNFFKTKKLAVGLVAGVAMLGLSTSFAAAEEMTLAITVHVVQSNVTVSNTPDEDNPGYVGFQNAHGLVLTDGDFIGWYEGVVTFQFSGVQPSTWQAVYSYIFPDESKLFLSADGTAEAGAAVGQVVVVGGTGRFADATGTGTLTCFNPPSDPPGFPALNTCPGELQITY